MGNNEILSFRSVIPAIRSQLGLKERNFSLEDIYFNKEAR